MNLRQEIERLTPALRRMSRALVSAQSSARVDVADDLVHETLLRALRFEEPAKGVAVHHWLCAILIGINRQQNRAVNSRQAVTGQMEENARGQNRQLGQHFQARADYRRDFDAPGHSCSATPAAVEPVSEAVASLAGLALEEREALLLVVLEGMSYSQTAAILGIPKEAVVARLARARAHMVVRSPDRSRRAAPAIPHLRLVN